MLAWWLLKQKAMFSLWGQEGFAVDLVVTGFIMLLMLASIVVPLNRRKMTRGALSALMIAPLIWLATAPQEA